MKASILIAINTCLLAQGSDATQKLLSDNEVTTETQSLSASPTSLSDLQNQSLLSTISLDNLSDQEVPQTIHDNFQITQRHHQKLLYRLNHEKEKFVAYQEAEKNNSPFSRWERFRKKPEQFQAAQETSRKNFINSLQEQLKASQERELASLEVLLKAEGQISKSDNHYQKHQKHLSNDRLNMDIEKMKARHFQEQHNMTQLPEPRFGEKLTAFYDRR